MLKIKNNKVKVSIPYFWKTGVFLLISGIFSVLLEYYLDRANSIFHMYQIVIQCFNVLDIIIPGNFTIVKCSTDWFPTSLEYFLNSSIKDNMRLFFRSLKILRATFCKTMELRLSDVNTIWCISFFVDSIRL